jgi:hypothetical protein
LLALLGNRHQKDILLSVVMAVAQLVKHHQLGCSQPKVEPKARGALLDFLVNPRVKPLVDRYMAAPGELKLNPIRAGVMAGLVVLVTMAVAAVPAAAVTKAVALAVLGILILLMFQVVQPLKLGGVAHLIAAAAVTPDKGKL